MMGSSRSISSFWRSDDSFAEHRLRTVLIALTTGVISVGALAAGPGPDGRFTTAWVTVSSAVLSLALITLIYELLLRQSHAIALRRFIRLNSTVVGSGLQSIVEEPDVEWRELFQTSTEVTFILVSPYRAVGYLNDAIRAASSRAVTIRFCFPDLPDDAPGQPDLPDRHRADTFARSIGADSRLASSLSSTIEDLVTTFERESLQLGAGSKLVVAVYEGPVFTEGVVLDDATVLMLIDCGGRPRGAPPACMVFTGSQSPEINRLREGLKALSASAVAVESKEATHP